METTSMESNSMNRSEKGKGCTVSRRSIFPTYEAKLRAQKSVVASLPNNHEKKRVHFSPTARVLLVKCRHNMSSTEKSRIWFQDSDFNRFEKSAQIIVKPSLKRGEEVWLTSDTSRWSNPHNRNQRKNVEKRNKWWCTFGHSRRGLEQIVSKEEGLQRQRNVNTVVKAVLDEQSRQRVNRINDPKRLADVSLKHTLWARNLALADAAADHEAVQSNFDTKTKSRVHHWNVISNQFSSSSSTTSVCAFRAVGEAILPSSHDISIDFLDANTSSTLTYHQQQLYGMRSKHLRNFVEEVAELHDFIADQETKPCISSCKTFGSAVHDYSKKSLRGQGYSGNIPQGDLFSTTLAILSKLSMASLLLWRQCHQEEEICSFI